MCRCPSSHSAGFVWLLHRHPSAREELSLQSPRRSIHTMFKTQTDSSPYSDQSLGLLSGVDSPCIEKAKFHNYSGSGDMTSISPSSITLILSMVNIATSTQEIPSVEFPLHTLIELTPKPDGKMSEHHIHFDIRNKRHLEVYLFLCRPLTSEMTSAHRTIRFL